MRFAALLEHVFRLGADQEVFEPVRQAQAVLARRERVRREGLGLFLVSLLEGLELGEFFRGAGRFLLARVCRAGKSFSRRSASDSRRSISRICAWVSGDSG